MLLTIYLVGVPLMLLYCVLSVTLLSTHSNVDYRASSIIAVLWPIAVAGVIASAVDTVTTAIIRSAVRK